MRYVYSEGVSGAKKSKKWLAIPLLGIVVGGYVIFNALSPAIPDPFQAVDAVARKLTRQQPVLDQNRLYIPLINVDVAIVEGETADSLEKGAWHRKPANGDPIDGGNFVLSAHLFNLGFTPDQTKQRSPFYRIDRLNEGDQLYVDYDGTRYAYSVTRRYDVDRTAVEIEKRSDDSKLTLYSCDLRGERIGREIIEAKPIGTVAWDNGKPKLKSL